MCENWHVFSFNITAKDSTSSARTGVFTTPHGDIHTPVFMPCGTKGSVKTLTPDELKTLGCEVILGNTYHLMLRPGEEIVAQMGGLHNWIKWDRPILTDSGGFQVFSLSNLRHITDEGVTFQSHIDGAPFNVTPERAIQIQEKLGADIIMAFDECPPGDASYEEVKRATNRTHEWAVRSLSAKKRDDQALFPIVQGGVFEDLRKESALFISKLPAHGYAIGGVAVGEPKPFMENVLKTVCPILPVEKPRYLMGIGEPLDLLLGIENGIDMFDCVLPTRLARHGSYWTQTGPQTITWSKNQTSSDPLDESCECYTCANGFSKSYLRHLIMEKEILAPRLLTIHNLHFLIELMGKSAVAIKENRFTAFASEFRSKFTS